MWAGWFNNIKLGQPTLGQRYILKCKRKQISTISLIIYYYFYSFCCQKQLILRRHLMLQFSEKLNSHLDIK